MATSQLGPTAVAQPAVSTLEAAPVPELHHLDLDKKHTTETQLGPNAIAPPAGATAESEDDLVFHDIPPFPGEHDYPPCEALTDEVLKEDAPIAPLLRLSLKRLMDNDPEEVDKFWQASRDLGFFYLDCRGAIQNSKRDSAHDLPESTLQEGKINGDGLLKDAEALFELGKQVFALPLEEKEPYDYAKSGTYFGYKGIGQGIVDAKGTRDRMELWNISKDDILGYSERQPNPELLQRDSNRALFKSFIVRSQAIITLLLSHLNDKLGLPTGTLQGLHRLQGISGDQLRWLCAPPQSPDDRKLSSGEHTDFGSLTILFNRLGGLQIRPPNSEQWCYVKPLKGHCVCNLGDAMVKFTAGILRSNIHRVNWPPGEQAHSTRYSLVYFSRPEDEVMLKALDGSDMINEKRAKQVEFAGEECMTSKEWTLRRAFGRRVGGDWKATLGTEGEERLTK